MNKLDLIDKKILYELDLNSRISFKELGKKLNIAKETASFRVKRLVKNGYIKNFITTILTSNLNRFYYKLFFKFHKTTPEIDKEIIEFIRNNKTTAYLASLEGRYDVIFLILSKDMRDLYSFLVPFREKFGEYVSEQEILTMPEVHKFNFRFFYENGKLLHTKYPVELSEPKIDNLDYIIIKTLAKNSRTNLIEIAQITKTETNVVKYRIKKLKQANIIGTHVLDINIEKFGLQQFQISYSLKNLTSINKIIEFVSQIPQSTFATVTLGKYDLAVEFAVKNGKELREIMNNIKTQFADEINDHEVFIMEEHKINWFPFELENNNP
ncbi:MAG: Lrp/AsnC family transcriptional regulator [Candidatus Woesearchaeota archaeon]|jgi:DNA-binding Lrp family transcriptional regulator|nr:Lrp/AsnC family transcriptional regulator [Candidatus Woesearchaeota archaeon]